MSAGGVRRLQRRFQWLKEQNRCGFIPFISCGDPDLESSQALLESLPGAGADIIELGAPFSDPSADGAAIQQSSARALAAGARLEVLLEMAAAFRRRHADIPLVLMGYCNPLHAYGMKRFAFEAADCGVDGLLVVDLPAEEGCVLSQAAGEAGLAMVRTAAPTTDGARLERILADAGGFLYFISITGVTGGAAATAAQLSVSLRRLRRRTALPVAVGFGISSDAEAAAAARLADAVVVGSALARRIGDSLEAGEAAPAATAAALRRAGELSAAVHKARR